MAESPRGLAIQELVDALLPTHDSAAREQALRHAASALPQSDDGASMHESDRVLQSVREHLRNSGRSGDAPRSAELLHAISRARGEKFASRIAVFLLISAPVPQSTLPANAIAENDALVVTRPDGTATERVDSAARTSANGSDSSHSHPVPESVLVREVLYCCQGISGRHVVYDPKKERFTVRSSADVKASAIQLIRKLCELGWLYIHIHSCLRAMGRDSGAPSQPGLVGQALIEAVNSELREYFRYLASLEARVVGTTSKTMESTVLSHDSAGKGSITSLRQLSAWLVEPFRRLRALATLVDCVIEHKGGALLSVLHERRKSGDTREAEIAHNLLVHSSSPFYAALHKWIIEGELEDTFQEFFIAKTDMDHESEKEHLWQSMYSIVDSMRPSFVSERLAHDILHVGKCINFLRHCCNDSGWIEERGVIASASSKAGGLAYGNDGALTSMVALAKRRLNSRVLQTMFSRYRLGDHSSALKRFLLLGQGDFIQNMMDLMKHELDGSASRLTVYRLESTLDVAARGSNAKSDDNEILDRLHCQLLPGGNAELGWDVFTLRYSVDPPLTTVFNEWAMHRYLRIFNSLWRIKRVEYSLNSAWQRLKPNSVTRFSSLNRTPHERMLGTDLRRCHITRAEMSHVINNISYYMMFEVLESSWNTFRSAVASTHDLDSIIHAHENFLNDVLSAALLDQSSEALKLRLDRLCETMLAFAGVIRRLHDAAEEIYSRRLEAQRQAESTASRREWASTAASAGEAGEWREQLESVHEHLGRVIQDFRDSLEQFMNLLPLQKHVDLSSLFFRLDFSRFYTGADAAKPL